MRTISESRRSQATRNPSPGAPAHPLPVTLVIADPAVRAAQGLRRRFSAAHGFALIEAAGTPAEVLAICRENTPCVLVIDEAALKALEPVEFANSADFGRAIQVLVIGPEKDENEIQELMQKGCMGFLPNGASPSLLKRAIRAIARGELWVERRVVTRVLQQLLVTMGSPRLTSREKDILILIAAGWRNRAIAEQLSISYETVRWHIRGLHAKLGIQDRLGTALYAQQFLSHENASSK